MKRKILHISITSEIGGGPEHIVQLVKNSKNFLHYITAPNSGAYYQKFCALSEQPVLVLPHRKVTLYSLKKLQRFILDHKIDIIHSHGKGASVYAALIGTLNNRPVVHTSHGLSYLKVHSFSNICYRLFEFIFRKSFSYIIYVSKTEAAVAKGMSLWNKRLTAIIANGITATFPPEIAAWRKKYRTVLNNSQFTMIATTASRFDEQKNTLELCRIASLTPFVYYFVLGEGKDLEICKEYCKKMNLNNVEFPGAVLNPKQYMASSDFYISTAKWEGLSIAIIEAMSLGLPIVASKVDGNTDIVSDELNGLFYTLNDIDSATQAISRLKLEDFRCKLGAQALDDFNNFYSATSMVEKVEQIYSTVKK